MRRTFVLLVSLVLGLVLLGAAPAAAEDERLPVSYNFLGGAVLAGTQLDADPPGANDWDCRPSQERPRPVVLVHGTIGNKNTNWQTYSPLLKNHGYCVFALTYGVAPGSSAPVNQFGGLERIEDSAAEFAGFVAEVLAATGASEVDLIGHSQGTLMPNYYVKFLGGAAYVNRYISLAPLWSGTNSAALLAELGRALGVPEDGLPLCKACGQMATGSDFITAMREGGVAVDGVEYTNIMTRYDQLVLPYTSGSEAGMRNIVLQDRCGIDFSEHFQIAADPVAAQIVLNTLDPAGATRVRCQLVLPFVGGL
jgi:triacylglycerol lipase